MNKSRKNTQKERLIKKFDLNKDSFGFENDIDLLIKRKKLIEDELKIEDDFQSETILKYIWNIDSTKTIKNFCSTQIKNRTDFEQTLEGILYSQREYYARELEPWEENRLFKEIYLDSKEKFMEMSLYESSHSIQLEDEHDSLYELDPELRYIEELIKQTIRAVYQTMLLMFRKHDDRVVEILHIHEFKEIKSMCIADYEKAKSEPDNIREQHNPFLAFYFYMRSKYIMHYLNPELITKKNFDKLKFQNERLPAQKVYSLSDVASLLYRLEKDGRDGNSKKNTYEKLRKCFETYKIFEKNPNGTYSFSDPLWPIANHLFLKRKNKKHWHEFSYLEDDSIVYIYSVLQAMQAGEGELPTSMWNYIDYIKKEMDGLISFNPYPGHLERIDSLYTLTNEIYNRILFLGMRSL